MPISTGMTPSIDNLMPFAQKLFREFLSAFVGIEMPEREGAPDILEVEIDSSRS